MCLRVQFFGPLFFLIYINDLSGNLEANLKLIEDDTLKFLVVSDSINTSQKLNEDLDKVVLWANKWRMSLNLDITLMKNITLMKR